MSNPFFEHPILNTPYELPKRHWELDKEGQPTQRIIETRRRAEFISPIPKPKKHKGLTELSQIVFDEGKGLSTEAQQYEQTSLINAVRHEVGKWRALPNPNTWQVAPTSGKAEKGFFDANLEIMRLALKHAKGAGKTTLMAMLIAWQAGSNLC
jgi:type III restriction enzyme